MDITGAIERVRSSGARHGGGASAGEIADAEARLGAALPASYREFLATLGWAETDDFVVYGLGEDIPPLLDLIVGVDLERGDDPGSAMPPHLIPICPDGMGNHDCLDTSREQGGDCPVVYWGRTPGRAFGTRPVAPSFAAWLAERFAEEGGPPRGAGTGGVREGRPGTGQRKRPRRADRAEPREEEPGPGGERRWGPARGGAADRRPGDRAE